MQVKENAQQTQDVVEKIECLGKLFQRYNTAAVKDNDLIKDVESKLKELVNKL